MSVKIMERRVDVIEEAAMCGKCGGELSFTGLHTDMQSEPMYKHNCGSCGNQETLENKYPRTVFRRVE